MSGADVSFQLGERKVGVGPLTVRAAWESRRVLNSLRQEGERSTISEDESWKGKTSFCSLRRARSAGKESAEKQDMSSADLRFSHCKPSAFGLVSVDAPFFRGHLFRIRVQTMSLQPLPHAVRHVYIEDKTTTDLQLYRRLLRSINKQNHICLSPPTT